MSEWISVEDIDRLPDPGTWVNLLTDLNTNFEDSSIVKLMQPGRPMKDVVCGSLRYIGQPENWAYWQQGELASGHPLKTLDYVTHWQPLPGPPK